MTTAPQSVVDLVERYCRNRDQYRQSNYNETQVRVEFIDPLFEALGWDVHNERGASPQYQDVVHEASVRVRGSVRSPDYAFRMGPKEVFYVEAKKPSVNIHENTSPAYQLRRYAWTAKLPVSVLTDFEELSVYEGRRRRPKPEDSAATARVMYATCDEYLDRWDEIAGVLSKDAVMRGDLDRFAEKASGKRGTQEVDAAFLAEIEQWRLLLARNLALRNAGLSTRELNYAVQKIIDRIIFLRIAEDRGIEPYEQLRGDAVGDDIYPRLMQRFLRADAKYNSGLFHFGEEKGRTDAWDTITPGLAVDDKTLRQIIDSLYYPVCPYEFSVLGADILGHVYEQFLGSVISLTAGHRAKVEEKPEVRKAGGVYYTPTYIVDYIVQQTVGKLVEGKTPRQVERLRIVDPACGSGSFLLGAYQYLLDWHLNWYAGRDNARTRDEIYFDEHDQPRLSIDTKKAILTHNIYGVDIDGQAVEVTKLSLLLKVLEGENETTMGGQMALFGGERALPDLSRNIQCGNSLIGSDYLEQAGLGGAFMDEEEMYRVNPFDWEDAFAEVFNAHGGFDAVIGNPPYVRIQHMKQWAPKEVEWYKQHYISASKGNYDIYVVFVEKGLSLLNGNGLLGYILPHKFMNAKYGEPLRGLLAQGKHVREIVHFGDQQVFDQATTYTCLLFLSRMANTRVGVTKTGPIDSWRSGTTRAMGSMESDELGPGDWPLVVGRFRPVYDRMSAIEQKLGGIARLFVGLQTNADKVFIVEEVESEGDTVVCRSAATGALHRFEQIHLKKFVKGSVNIDRYCYKQLGKRLIFPYQVTEGQAHLIDEARYRNDYPLTWSYLCQCKDLLNNAAKKKSGKPWYSYVYEKNHSRLASRKILVPSLGWRSSFALDDDGAFYFAGSGGGGGGGYGISLNADVAESDKYVLGLLNSTPMSEYIRAISTPFRGGYFALNRQYIEQLPIRTIDFDDPADVAKHDRMVALVEGMLDLHKRLAAAQLPQKKTMLQRQIDATDKTIDRLVYDLYDLTEEEIAIVES